MEALTQGILDSGVLPAHADRDAAHIALATVHEMDILLSWSCRHIANAFIINFLSLCRAQPTTWKPKK